MLSTILIYFFESFIIWLCFTKFPAINSRKCYTDFFCKIFLAQKCSFSKMFESFTKFHKQPPSIVIALIYHILFIFAMSFVVLTLS